MTRFFFPVMAVAMLLFGELKVARAQFTEFRFGVNGLTCSQCTRSVEQQLKKLDFVEQVHMDLERTTGKIIPKEGVRVQPKAIAKAISDAGFSIRFLEAELHTSAITQQQSACFTYQGTAYYWKDGALPVDAAVVQLRFEDALFSSGKPWFWHKRQAVLPDKKAACRARDFYTIALKKS